jgi:uncharacterized protein (DUF983 family)
MACSRDYSKSAVDGMAAGPQSNFSAILKYQMRSNNNGFKYMEAQMDKQIMNLNMGFYDRINRIVIGSMILIAIMATNSLPPWVTLLTLYPILTAIIAWDPIYAMLGASFSKMRRSSTGKLKIKGGKLALE